MRKVIKVKGLGAFSAYLPLPPGTREPEHGGWAEGPGLEHLDGDPCVYNSPGFLPACSGCSGSEHTRSYLLSMQLSLQMAPFSTLWTSWNIAVETHVLPVVGVTAFSPRIP